MVFALVAIALGFVAAVGAAEVFLRNVDVVGRNYPDEVRSYFATAVRFVWEGRTPTEDELEGRMFAHRPGVEVQFQSFQLRANSLGLRGPEVTERKPDSVHRVLLLGDSVAFGWGVPDEVAFARRLESEWNAVPGRRRLEVLNAGHPLYDTSQQAATLREYLPRVAPDVVLLVYVVNDIEPTRDTMEQLMLGKQPDPAEALVVPDDTWSWLEARMQPWLPSLAQFVGTHTNIQERVAAMQPAGRPVRMEELGKGPRGWLRSQRCLLAMRDLCASAGVPLLLLDHTMPPIESLVPFCAEKGIAYAPFRFSSEDFAQDITNSRLDPHANSKGHALLAQRLREILVARDLLPR